MSEAELVDRVAALMVRVKERTLHRGQFRLEYVGGQTERHPAMIANVIEEHETRLDASDDPQEWDRLTAQLKQAVRQQSALWSYLRDRADEAETLGISGAECSHSCYGWVVSGQFSDRVLMHFPKKYWAEVVNLSGLQFQ